MTLHLEWYEWLYIFVMFVGAVFMTLFSIFFCFISRFSDGLTWEESDDDEPPAIQEEAVDMQRGDVISS